MLQAIQDEVRGGLLWAEERLRSSAARVKHWKRIKGRRFKWIIDCERRRNERRPLFEIRDALLERQRSILQQIGDACAWVVLGYDTRLMAVLYSERSHHLSSDGIGLFGPISAASAAHESGEFFVLENDLTRALGVGDITVVPARTGWLHPLSLEVKTSGEFIEGNWADVVMYVASSNLPIDEELLNRFCETVAMRVEDAVSIPRNAVRQIAELKDRSELLLKLSLRSRKLVEGAGKAHWPVIARVLSAAGPRGIAFDRGEEGLVYAAITATEQADVVAKLSSLSHELSELGLVPDAMRYAVVNSGELQTRAGIAPVALPIALWRVPQNLRRDLLSGDLYLICFYDPEIWTKAFAREDLRLSERDGHWYLKKGEGGAWVLDPLDVRRLRAGLWFGGYSPAGIAKEIAGSLGSASAELSPSAQATNYIGSAYVDIEDSGKPHGEATGDIGEASADLIDALQALWLHSGFKPESGGRTAGGVWTEAEAEARRLPNTRRPVRGTPGVSVRVSDGSLSWGPPTLHTLVFRSLLYAENWPKDAKGGGLESVEHRVHQAFIRLRGACLHTGELALRLFESRAFKHHELEEVRALVGEGGTNGFEDFLMHFSPVVEDALGDAGFSWEERAAFDRWDDAATNLAVSLVELATREFHEYDALAFLNGPLVDSEEPVVIGSLPDDPAAAISLGFADDESLRRARHEGFSLDGDALPGSIRNANTLVTFVVRVPVDAPVVDYLNVYPRAARWVARILDLLRIAQAGEIGVGGLRVSPRSRYAPKIRRWHSWEFEPDAAPHQGRRTIFLPPREAITQDEVELVRALLAVALPGFERKGLDVALSRFRDSYERYAADDPNRLLDVAIAFEALLLNDGVDKELTYRLSLRGARWLDQSLESRRETFGTLRLLYTMRSKIAHGSTFNTLKPQDIDRLERVMAAAPALLRRTLQYVFEGRGPTAMNDEQLREWWMAVELS